MKHLLLFSSLIAVSAFSQSLIHEWSMPYGGNNNQYLQTIAGNGSGEIVSVGFFNAEFFYEDADDLNIITSNGDDDIFIQKTTSDGDVIWAKGIGGTGKEYGFDNFVDATGNIYITGNFQNTVDFDPNEGVYELTALGTGPDIFVLKLNANGELIWAKSFSGTGYDYGKSITVDSTGNIYLAGDFQNTVDFDPNAGVTNLTSNGLDDIFLLKLDEDGNLIWVNSYGGSMRDNGKLLALDDFGDVILAGTFQDSVNFNTGGDVSRLTAVADNDVYILKVEPNGTFDWVKQLGGTEIEDVLALETNAEGAIIIGGYYIGEVDLDPNESELIFSSPDRFAGYVTELNKDGELNVAQTFSSSGYIMVNQLLVTENQDIYVGGFFTNSAGIETPVGVPSFVSEGETDAFLAVYDQNHDFKWSGQISGAAIVTLQGIELGEDDNIYLGGSFSGTIDTDPNLTTTTISGVGNEIFLTKLDASTLTIQSHENNQNEFVIFPNPTNGIFELNLPNHETANNSLAIFSITGKLVYQQEITDPHSTLNLTHLKSGIYVLKYMNQQTKLIIE